VKDKSWICNFHASSICKFHASFFGGDYRPETCNKFHNCISFNKKSKKYWRGDEQMLEGGLEALQRPPHQGVTLKRMQDPKR